MRIYQILQELNKELEIGQYFIEEDEIKLVEEKLNLNKITDVDTLGNIRDMVVMLYTIKDYEEKESINAEESFRKWQRNQNNMSGILSVIDKRIMELK